MIPIQVKDIKAGQTVFEQGYGSRIELVACEDARDTGQGWECQTRRVDTGAAQRLYCAYGSPYGPDLQTPQPSAAVREEQESAMEKKIDETFLYRGYHGCESSCRLRVYEAPGEAPVVIVSEQPDNPGTSVTNQIEHLATEIWKLLERPESGMQLIEHYPDRTETPRRSTCEETFAYVSFTAVEAGFKNPTWRHVPKSEIERRIGQALRADTIVEPL